MNPEAIDEVDRRYLRRALSLAARGRYGVAPNPMVGAVVVRREGDASRVLGEGWHQRAGEPHAEILALRAAGDAARGATVYVSLEPCDHHGRTPPCSRALIDAGVARVVVCHRDPNPRVGGNGFRRLRDAGIAVAVAPSDSALIQQAIRLNWRFLVQHVLGRPAITLKWAMSLDGRIATTAGQSQWISGARGRRWALAQREEHDAILVGSGTALADDPRLDRRLGKARGPILRAVFDRRLRLPTSARMLAVDGPVVVYARPARGGAVQSAAALRRAGAEVVELADASPAAVVEDLGRRGVQSLLIEGGAEVLGAFVADRLFDRIAVCCAPLVIGGAGAPGPVAGPGFELLADAPRLAPFEARRRGNDIVLTTFRESCLRDLSESVAG